MGRGEERFPALPSFSRRPCSVIPPLYFRHRDASYLFLTCIVADGQIERGLWARRGLPARFAVNTLLDHRRIVISYNFFFLFHFL